MAKPRNGQDKRSGRRSQSGGAKSTRGTEDGEKMPRRSPERQDAEAASPFPIVGVGASAGGLEAFTELLAALPPEPGIALVFVQHLAPTHDSVLRTLLARDTPLTVLIVEDGMEIEQDHVYVIPPDRNMAVLNGRLSLFPRAEAIGRHLAIDYFFRSLASDQKNRAVGVLLSGTGSDGTLGLQAIKAEGGLTFVQSRSSAKYDGMPASAIAADVADFVLTPKEIAGELTRIGQHGYVLAPSKSPEEEFTGETESAFSKILITLRMETGIDFAQYKPTTLRRRIARRMALHKIESLPQYLRDLKEDSGELARLCQDILINVTGFFRDPETFDVLKRLVFPQLFPDRIRESPIRMWVPGCSTGEEAYSIAIALVEYLGERAARIAIQVFATDINEAAISRARTGIYLENISADVSPERLSRFFNPVVGGYQVSKNIRAMVAFSRQDITRDPPFSKLDLISCRNVLIYMSQNLQKIVIPTFHFALNPGGMLMLGNSETIGEFSDMFKLIDKTHKMYLKKSTPSQLAQNVRMPAGESRPNPNGQSAPPLLKNDFDVQRAADQVALARFAPAGVVVDEHAEILQFRGATGTYLEPAAGSASLNLLKMARPGLLLDLRSALSEARESGQVVRKTNAQFRTEGSFQHVNIEVIPIKPLRGANQTYYMVVFEPIAGAREAKSELAKSAKVKGKRGTALSHEQQVKRLEDELTATKAYLESTLQQYEHTNEELHGALEEIQSSNEELQSTNEELETAKEELQATNEELTTLNEELQNRNHELSEVNNDLTNVLTSVSIPILIIGGDLRIRRFTPTAETVMGLIPGDVGRPLQDLNLRIVVPRLEPLIRQVLETLEMREEEVQDRDKHWYLLRVRPYQTADHRIEGVVLVLFDIESSKQLGKAEEARDLTRAIVETVRDPLVVLDGALSVQMANRAFYRMFQLAPEKTEGRLMYEIGTQWNIPKLRELLEEILPKNSHFEDFPVDAEFPGAGRKQLILNARRIDRPGVPAQFILLAMEEADK